MKNQIEILRRLYRNRYKKVKNKNYEKNQLDEKVLRKLNTEGIVIIENFFTKELCDEIISSIDKYIEDRRDFIANVKKKVAENQQYKFGVPMDDGSAFWVDEAEADVRIVHAEKINEIINEKFFLNDTLINIGEQILQAKLARDFTMANRISFKQYNLGSGGGWHRDNGYQNGFKALIYLNDVTNENGPFEYIKRSFTLKNHLFDFPYPDKYQFTEKEIADYVAKNTNLYSCVIGKAGTLVLFNTNAIHRGKPVKDGVRYAITNYYNFMPNEIS